MKVCVVGPGRIGGNLAHRCAQSGHDVVATFAGDALAAEARLQPFGVTFQDDGCAAARGADVVVLSVPWPAIDAAWASIGGRTDAVVVDTTNPFDENGLVELRGTSAEVNARRFGVAAYAKAFNTLTSAFQQAAYERPEHRRAAMFYAATDIRARQTVESLIKIVGFVPIWVGVPAESAIMEAPRRMGAVYGEEFTPDGARALLGAELA